MGTMCKVMVQYLCITLVTPWSNDTIWAAHPLKSSYELVSPRAEEFRVVIYAIKVVSAPAVGHASYIVEYRTWLLDFVFYFLQNKHNIDVRIC